LPEHNFSSRDAVFFTDAAQVEYLTWRANLSFRGGWACPFSLQAYGALLKRGHLRIISYFQFIDFADCKDWYHRRALRHAQSWLRELGLSFQVEKLDVAGLDSLCQFLFFLHAGYLGPTAERLIQAHPEIETFHLFAPENRLPQDFYFDSDVSAAILQGICEKNGRQVQAITTHSRFRYTFPDFQGRPMVYAHGQNLEPDPRIHKDFHKSRHRVGFVPATVFNAQRILDATRALGYATVLFPSAWAPLPPSAGNKEPISEFILPLTAADGDCSSAISAKLDKLADKFFQHRSRSTSVLAPWS
jgi:hypothetical protein